MSTVNLNDVILHYDVTGVGPPLVWVMGTGMGGDAWKRSQVPAFSDRFRCVTYDMRGVGESDCPNLPYTPQVLAADLLGLLDHLEFEQADLIGFSLGSVTIQELTLAHPDRVRSAVLLSTWSSSNVEHHVRRHYLSRRMALLEAPIEVFRSFAFWMWSPTLVDEEHDRIMELEAFLGTVTGGKHSSGFVGHFDADLMHDALPRLGSMKCPTLVLHGDEDLITLPAYNERVASAIPGARCVTIPRAGHLAYLEQPQAVNEAIASFLEERP